MDKERLRKHYPNMRHPLRVAPRGEKHQVARTHLPAVDAVAPTTSNTRKTIPLQSVPLPFSDAAYLYGVPSQLSASSTIERRIPWTRSSSVRTSTLCSFPLPEWPRLTDLLLRQPPSSNNMTSTSIPASLADVYPLVFIVCKFTKLIVKLC